MLLPPRRFRSLAQQRQVNLARRTQLLELGLGAPDLKIWNTASRGVAHSLAIAELAQSSNLLVRHARIDDHGPILFHALGLCQRRMALKSKMVIQKWHPCHKL